MKNAGGKTDTFAERIKKGAVGVMPTDTIYGLVGSALSKKAIERIYELKGRDKAVPLIVLIGSWRDLETFGVGLTEKEEKTLRALWPNSVSVILPCPSKKFRYLHRGTGTIAFRFPRQKWLRDILAQTGPIVATSVNPSGEPHAATIEDAKAYFGDQIDFYDDDGAKPELASTIVSLENGSVYVLRQGAYELPKNLKPHRLIKKKAWPELFEAVRKGSKKFDLRIADFEAAEGDLLLLEEWDPKKQAYTGRMLKKKISYVLKFHPDRYPFAETGEAKKHGLQILSF